MEKNKIITDVANYYTNKLQVHGATSKGVDWNSAESQEMRFEQLLKVISPENTSFSILDYGCGFGAMLPFMQQKYKNNLSFIGYDISEDMIKKAKEIYANQANSQWINKIDTLENIDFTVASGIFNVRLEHQDIEWKEYIIETLHQFDKLSVKGFSFNMLTSYSDTEYMRDYLYYANPSFFFDYCKIHFSKYVTILHDYPLYEFTILVKK